MISAKLLLVFANLFVNSLCRSLIILLPMAFPQRMEVFGSDTDDIQQGDRTGLTPHLYYPMVAKV